ncbi:MAG: BadF/BadG/BcrA/BcrD ATPase family protein [Bacillota bacterium]
MRLLLGVDGGGTKTACALCDEDGHVLGFAVGGPSNHLSLPNGEEALRKVLRDVIEGAFSQAGTGARRVDAACLAMAGVGLSRQSEVVARIASEVVPARDIVIENDALAALVGATAKSWGVVVISGTGSIAVGIDRNGRRARAGGWGYLIGDEGSGYDIGRRGLAAAARAHDGRGDHTLLVERAVAHYRLETPDDLRSVLYRSETRVREIASFAPLVVASADEGDAISLDILRSAGRELGLSAVAVVKALGLGHEEFDVAPCGSVFKAGELVIDPFRSEVLRAAPSARIVNPRFPAVIGALMIALERTGRPVDALFLSNMTRSCLEYGLSVGEATRKVKDQ